jgi:hypothetical protein
MAIQKAHDFIDPMAGDSSSLLESQLGPYGATKIMQMDADFDLV